jgi:hypothetical protein
MSNEHIYHGDGPEVNNPYEHNSNEGFQGEFRYTPLDFNLLKYAINKDPYIRNASKVLVVTCLDTVKEFVFTIDGEVYITRKEEKFLNQLSQYLGINSVMTSRSPYSEQMG